MKQKQRKSDMFDIMFSNPGMTMEQASETVNAPMRRRKIMTTIVFVILLAACCFLGWLAI